MKIADRKISRAAVFGFGRTGRAVATFFLARGITPFVTDAGTLSSPAREFLEKNAIPYEERGHTLRALTGADIAIISPGVRPGIPIIAQARERGIPVLSEIDLASFFLGGTPLVAVTGTNGKSTTVKLIEVLLTEQGLNVVSAGNIGIPLITRVDERYDAIVVEVSSFQLEQSHRFHPHVGVLLNITPDHLDRHGTLENYRAVKLRLFSNQTGDDYVIVPRELAPAIAGAKARPVYYDHVALPPLPGTLPHNRSNLQAAIAAARCIIPFNPATVSMSTLADAFSLPYRMQVEGRVNGARVINDSKSTNAASTIAALRSIDAPTVLILGGRHKRAGYDALAQEIAARPVRTVIYGEAGPFLAEHLRITGINNVKIFSEFSNAVICAMDNIKSGEVLLFSPACSSYDQFTSYIERGKSFSTLVHANPMFTP